MVVRRYDGTIDSSSVDDDDDDDESKSRDVMGLRLHLRAALAHCV